MAQQIFTRNALSKIMTNENLSAEERTEQIYSMFGRALDEGYVSRDAAQQARDKALSDAKAEWEKGITTPDPTESDAYKQLAGEFDAYKQKQTMIASEDFSVVKPKFRDQVYGMLDREDGAKPVKEQLESIRKEYEEYYVEPVQQQKPTFGAPVEGSMPKGETGAVKGFADAWGFVPKKT